MFLKVLKSELSVYCCFLTIRETFTFVVFLDSSLAESTVFTQKKAVLNCGSVIGERQI